MGVPDTMRLDVAGGILGLTAILAVISGIIWTPMTASWVFIGGFALISFIMAIVHRDYLATNLDLSSPMMITTSLFVLTTAGLTWFSMNVWSYGFLEAFIGSAGTIAFIWWITYSLEPSRA